MKGIILCLDNQRILNTLVVSLIEKSQKNSLTFVKRLLAIKQLQLRLLQKSCFDDKDCSIAAKFEYGTPEVETMTNDEFNEVFEERLNKLMKNERRCR